RVSDLGGAAEEGGVVEPGAGEAGHGGHAAGGDGGAGGDLVAHGLDRRGGRADEHQPGRLAGAGEAGAFGEETVAGVHGSGAAGKGGGDERVPVEVGVDAQRAVGGGDVRGVGVLVGVDGDRGQAERAQGAQDPQRDLAAVGDQHRVEAGGAGDAGDAGAVR